MNKFILLLLSLLFFPHILDQICLFVCFLFFLFLKKSKYCQDDYIQVNFSSLEEFDTWVNMIKNRSFVNFNTSVNEKDHILTLSTCYDDEKKTVLHAKLIKKEAK